MSAVSEIMQRLLPQHPTTRREALDSYGQLVQCSALVFLLLATIWRQVTSRRRSGTENETGKGPATSPLHGRSRTFLGEPLKTVLIVFPSIVLLLLIGIFYIPSISTAEADVKTDYIYYTRLPVQLLASLLPFHVLFSNSSTLNVLPALFNISHTKLVSFHRTLGWTFMLLFAVHGSMYMNFYINRGIVWKRIQDSDVQLGMALSTMFSALAFAARKSFRTSVGKNWVWAHISSVSFIGVLLWFHVVQTRAYVKEAAVIAAVGVAWRAVRRINTRSAQTQKAL